MYSGIEVDVEKVVKHVSGDMVLSNPEKYVAEALCNPDLSYSETIELLSQWIGAAYDEGYDYGRVTA